MEIHKTINGYIINAVICGDRISEKYNMLTEIKAITYNDMEIEEKDKECMIQVVVDI